MTLRGVRFRRLGDILVKKPIYYQHILDRRETDVHHNVSEGMVIKVLEHLFMSQIPASRGLGTIIEAFQDKGEA